MSDIKVEISELEKYLESFNEIYENHWNWERQIVDKYAEKFVGKVQNRTPVDTGQLKASWKKLPATFSGPETVESVVVNRADYASFVEFGHAKPYKSGASPGSSDWVDGYFMLTITEEDVQRALPKWFERDFIDYMKSGGIV